LKIVRASYHFRDWSSIRYDVTCDSMILSAYGGIKSVPAIWNDSLVWLDV
jgi:hypothetical protein